MTPSDVMAGRIDEIKGRLKAARYWPWFVSRDERPDIILIWCDERKAWQSASWVSDEFDTWEQVDATTKKLVHNKNGYWDTLAQSWDFWMPQPSPPSSNTKSG